MVTGAWAGVGARESGLHGRCFEVFVGGGGIEAESASELDGVLMRGDSDHGRRDLVCGMKCCTTSAL